jgi:DNA repair protein RadC
MSLEYPQLMPREKLLKFGVEALSDTELLALFLRTGTRNLPVLALSQSLLNDFGSLYNLINASHQDFCQKNGLGTAKYTQLKAVVELSSRYLKVKMAHENLLSSPSVLITI